MNALRKIVNRGHRELVDAQREATTWEQACSIARAAEALVRLRHLPATPSNDNAAANGGQS